MLRFHAFLFSIFLVSVCQTPTNQVDQFSPKNEPLAVYPFEFLANTLIVVEPSIAADRPRFLLDTGAGFDVISSNLCQKLGFSKLGKITGKRMRGDEVTLDLTHLETLEFAGVKKTNWAVGVTNLFNEIPAVLGKIDGALSLKFFVDHSFTIDFPKRQILMESTGSFEVDTGNMTTILPKMHLKRLKIDLDSAQTKVIKNENMDRVYSVVNGKIGLENAPKVTQENPKICSENVIYDGVIGGDFLKDKIVTFDVPNARVIFSNKINS